MCLLLGGGMAKADCFEPRVHSPGSTRITLLPPEAAMEFRHVSVAAFHSLAACGWAGAGGRVLGRGSIHQARVRYVAGRGQPE
jgi:hypothetical protein